MWWGELSSECGVSSLLNGASCLLDVGRVVLGRVFFGASCLGASCLWGELSVIPLDTSFTVTRRIMKKTIMRRGN